MRSPENRAGLRSGLFPKGRPASLRRLLGAPADEQINAQHDAHQTMSRKAHRGGAAAAGDGRGPTASRVGASIQPADAPRREASWPPQFKPGVAATTASSPPVLDLIGSLPGRAIHLHRPIPELPASRAVEVGQDRVEWHAPRIANRTSAACQDCAAANLHGEVYAARGHFSAIRDPDCHVHRLAPCHRRASCVSRLVPQGRLAPGALALIPSIGASRNDSRPVPSQRHRCCTSPPAGRLGEGAAPE